MGRGALALLPGGSGDRVRRIKPEPFSLGEREDVTVVVENAAAAGLNARVGDHAPADLKPQPREAAGRFAGPGRLQGRYRTFSPKRGAYRFGPIDLQVWRDDGWRRRKRGVRAPVGGVDVPN